MVARFQTFGFPHLHPWRAVSGRLVLLTCIAPNAYYPRSVTEWDIMPAGYTAPVSFRECAASVVPFVEVTVTS